MAAVLVMTVGLLAVPAYAGPSSLAAASIGPLGIEWRPSAEYEKLVLTVSGPGGLILHREFDIGVAPSLEPFGDDGKPLPDGAYTYEFVATPMLDQATRRALAAARRSRDDSIIEKLRAAGKLPREPLSQSGSFTIAGGAILPQDPREEQSGGNGSAQTKRSSRLRSITAELVVPDEVIIQGNNPRLQFDDTSATPGFPNNDWQVTANDSAAGGANKLSIEDLTGAKVPFTITAGAASNSIFVDSTGRVGFRTSTPVLDLHVNTGNTPAMRLEQNASGGFTAQTWDIAGNEANFFIRDVTGGSRLPFRIRPGAPTSSIDISAAGNIGIGTALPSNKVHVLSSDSGADAGKVLIQNSSGTTSARELLELRNNGGPIMVIADTTVPSTRWTVGTSGSTFIVDNQGNGGNELIFSNTGNLFIAGTLTQGSSRDLKTQFASLNPKDVLSEVTALPISLWSYKSESAVRHIGPMAEDFHRTFGLGADDKHIAPSDQAGVALVALQGLNQVVQQVVQEKDNEIAELKQANADLKSRLEALEKMVQDLIQQKGTPEN
ncbi:MAG TPA: tail fiber domain-containing protein [Thermoanaerobaculia bacterium]